MYLLPLQILTERVKAASVPEEHKGFQTIPPGEVKSAPGGQATLSMILFKVKIDHSL
jgi:hypothetical protein